jgi:hypothetical protein
MLRYWMHRLSLEVSFYRRIFTCWWNVFGLIVRKVNPDTFWSFPYKNRLLLSHCVLVKKAQK